MKGDPATVLYEELRRIMPSLPEPTLAQPLRGFTVSGTAGFAPTVTVEFDVVGDVLALMKRVES